MLGSPVLSYDARAKSVSPAVCYSSSSSSTPSASCHHHRGPKKARSPKGVVVGGKRRPTGAKGWPPTGAECTGHVKCNRAPAVCRPSCAGGLVAGDGGFSPIVVYLFATRPCPWGAIPISISGLQPVEWRITEAECAADSPVEEHSSRAR